MFEANNSAIMDVWQMDKNDFSFCEDTYMYLLFQVSTSLVP